MTSFREEKADEILSGVMNEANSMGSASTAHHSTTNRGHLASPGLSLGPDIPATEENICDTYDGAFSVSGNSLGVSVKDSATDSVAWDTKEPDMLGRDQKNHKPCDDNAEADNGMNWPILRQIEANPMCDEQLFLEIKRIYAGLLIAERTCVDLGTRYSSAAQEQKPSKQMRSGQWQGLVAVHKLLIHECHDFLLASQHPSASDALKMLAVKTSIPRRLWFHGIENLLGIMRCNLPESLEYMISFIYISYNMLTVLLETVPFFEDTWIECLGDLARYRWAINDDIEEQIRWGRIARSWYEKKQRRNPHIGRLYHSLALLAGPGTLEQLALFTKSLTCINAFEGSQSSVMGVFEPGLEMPEPIRQQAQCLDLLFLEAHGSLFRGGPIEKFSSALDRIRNGTLERHITAMGEAFRISGAFAAVINLSALFAFGNTTSDKLPISIFRLAFENVLRFEPDTSMPRSFLNGLSPTQLESSLVIVESASNLAFATLSIALQRPEDKNVFPMVYVMLVFLWRLIWVPNAFAWVQKGIPWELICSFLNAILESGVSIPAAFEDHDLHDRVPLPEDHVMQGHMFFEGCFPDDWFDEEAEPTWETPEVSARRTECILRVGCRIAASCSLIRLDTRLRVFQVDKEQIESDQGTDHGFHSRF